MHVYSNTPRDHIDNGVEIMKLVCDDNVIFKFAKLIKYRDDVHRFCEKYCREYAKYFSRILILLTNNLDTKMNGTLS